VKRPPKNLRPKGISFLEKETSYLSSSKAQKGKSISSQILSNTHLKQFLFSRNDLLIVGGRPEGKVPEEKFATLAGVTIVPDPTVGNLWLGCLLYSYLFASTNSLLVFQSGH
jgi:hypothetical protein